MTFEVLDVRELAFEARFDAVICLCQGGFGLLGGARHRGVRPDGQARSGPAGGIAVSAFHAPFAVRHLEAGESFDAATGVLHERATLRDRDGDERVFDLWTTCFTAREMQLLARVAGLEVDVAVHGVTPGGYRHAGPDPRPPRVAPRSARRR